MFKNIFIFILVCSAMSVNAQTTGDKPKILYGICSKTDLMAAPFDTWFVKNHEAYIPDSAAVLSLKKEGFRNVSIRIFFGTWCGDSKREVPRFYKLLEAIGFPMDKVMLIATGASDSLYKQSPQHEEAGLGIFKVPTFIFYKNGNEINRLVEFPSLSLERDMLAILQGKAYTPNYASFELIRKWLSTGLLTDPNISAQSIAAQLRPVVYSENELNSLGYVLLAQQKMKEAIIIFQANYYLYPQSANIASSLGEGYLKTGDIKNAVYYLEYALAKNTDPKMLRGILDLLYKAKGLD